MSFYDTPLDFIGDQDIVGPVRAFYEGKQISDGEWAQAVEEHRRVYIEHFLRGGAMDQLEHREVWASLVYEENETWGEFDLRYKFVKFCEMYPVLGGSEWSKTREFSVRYSLVADNTNRAWEIALVHDVVYGLRLYNRGGNCQKKLSIKWVRLQLLAKGIMIALLASLALSLLLVHTLEGKSSGALVVAVSSVLSTVIGSTVDIARLVLNAAAAAPLFVVTRPVFVTRLAGIVGIAVVCHAYQTDVLGIMDAFFRDVVNPAVHFLYTLVFAGRVVYEPVVALFNYYISVTKTAVYGSLTLITKCNTELFVSVLRGLFEMGMFFVRAVFGFLGAGNDGSLFTNDLDLRNTTKAAQTIVLVQREIFDCACEQLSGIFKVVAAVVEAEALTLAINNGANIIISLLQELLRTLPRWGEYPTLRKTFHHSQGLIHNLGVWIDHALLEGTSMIMQQIFQQDGIKLVDRPARFFGSALMGVAQAFLEAFYLVVRLMVHLLIPLRLSDPEYVFQLLSPREIFDVHLRGASDVMFASLHWVLEYSYSKMLSLPAPSPRLDCEFTPSFYGDRLFNSFFCAARHAARAGTTLLAIGTTLPVEFTIYGVIAQERNVWQMLQRYHGAYRFADPGLSSCEMRIASPWDLSTDITKCDCAFDEGIARPFPEFDKHGEWWNSVSQGKSSSCAQPQLEDVFRDLKTGVYHTSHIIVPFVRALFSALANGAINAASVGTRLVLSAEDILDGEFFQLPISQAGYGFREDLALKAWVEGGNSLVSSCKEGQIPETALPGSPCMAIDDVVRLHNARLRRYQGDGLCRSTNSDSGCTCNPALPAQSNSLCGCMLTFPDDESVAAESYTSARYTGQFENRGWCGSMVFEPIFQQLEEETGNAISSLVDGFHPGVGDGWCGKESYIVLETNMNQFTKREWINDAFLRDRARFTRDELDSFVTGEMERATLSREEAQLPPLSVSQLERKTLKITERGVVKLQGERALSDATGKCVLNENPSVVFDSDEYLSKLNTAPPSTRAECLLDKVVERSETLAVWKENTCTIRGSHDVVCAANAFAGGAAQIYIGTARQLWNGVVALLSGHPTQVTWDFSNRLCDIQKSLSYQVAVLTSLFPVERQTRKSVNKLLFLAVEFNVEQLSLGNSGLVLLDSLVKGELFTQKKDEGPILEYIKMIVGTFLKYAANLCDALGELVETFNEGSGAFLFSAREFIENFENAVTDVLLKTAGAFIELIAEFIAVASGKVSEIPALVKSLLNFFITWKLILPKIAMKTLGLILEAMGPIGKFLSSLAGTVCNVLQLILNGIIGAINGLTLGMAGLEEIDMGCLEGFGSDLNGTNLGNRRGVQELPAIINELGWEGASYCDNIVRSYASYRLVELRPLEKESIIDCLKQRWVGIQMSKQTGILDLQSVVYDWGARARAMYRLSRATFAHLDGMNVRQAKAFLDDVEFKQYLPAVRKALDYVSRAAPAYILSGATEMFDETAKSMRAQGKTSARIADAATATKKVAVEFVNHWSKHNMTRSAGFLFSAPGVAAAQWMAQNATNSAPKPQPGAQPNLVLSGARRKLTIVATRGHAAAKHALGYAFGAAGVRSNVEPCTTGIVCLNCAIVDNIIDTIIEEGIRVVLFLKYTWVEITLKEFKEHIKRVGLDLINGATKGLKGVFSDVSVPRLSSLSIRFDMARLHLGVDVKYAVKKALESAREAAGNAGETASALANFLEYAFENSDDTPGTAGSAALKNLRARADAYRAEYLKEYSLGADDAPFRELSYGERQALDWKFLWENFPNVPFNITHSRDSDVVENTVPTITVFKAFASYLSKATDEYVPLFGEPLFYSLAQPLFAKCTMDDVIYSESSTQQQRLDRVDKAFYYTLYAGIIIFGLQFYLGVPLLAITLFSPLASGFLTYLFLFIVYGWSVNCNPSMPVLLAADATAFINDRMHPNPICTSFPALVAQNDICDQQTSIRFGGRTEWLENVCEAEETYNELGYMYSTVYYLRALFPVVYNYFRQTQPFRFWLSGWTVLDLLDQETVLQENCARLLLLDVGAVFAVGGIAVWVVFTMLLPPTVAIVRAGLVASVQIVGLLNLLVLNLSEVEAE